MFVLANKVQSGRNMGRSVASASLCVMEVGCVPPSRDQVVERVATLRPMFRPL